MKASELIARLSELCGDADLEIRIENVYFGDCGGVGDVREAYAQSEHAALPVRYIALIVADGDWFDNVVTDNILSARA